MSKSSNLDKKVHPYTMTSVCKCRVHKYIPCKVLSATTMAFYPIIWWTLDMLATSNICQCQWRKRVKRAKEAQEFQTPKCLTSSHLSSRSGESPIVILGVLLSQVPLSLQSETWEDLSQRKPRSQIARLTAASRSKSGQEWSVVVVLFPLKSRLQIRNQATAALLQERVGRIPLRLTPLLQCLEIRNWTMIMVCSWCSTLQVSMFIHCFRWLNASSKW